jgi:hypothetical protein
MSVLQMSDLNPLLQKKVRSQIRPEQDVRETLNDFFSDDQINSAHQLLDQRIAQSGGIDDYKKALRKERRNNLKLRCVALKVLAVKDSFFHNVEGIF